MKHVPALDGVRGLAITLVMLDHTLARVPALQGQPWLDFLWSGVDLFFVLSGFLITGILLDAQGDPHYFRTFYARRVLRICPLYYSFLVGFFLVAVCLPGRPDMAWLLRHQGWFWCFGANLLIAFNSGFLPHLNPFWTLAVEEHFYLFWPWIVARANPVRLAVGAAVASLLVLLGRCLLVHFYGSQPAFVVLTPLRLDALLCGAILQVAVRTSARTFVVCRMLFVGGGLVLATALMCHVPVHLLAPAVQAVGFTLIALFYTGLMGEALGGASRFKGFFEQSWLRFLGRHAYGLYVVHVPVIEGLSAYLSGEEVAVLAWAVSLGIAWASYRWLESPFLRLKPAFSRG
ncbi:MAG TPA: acyltransferase [Candidatus Xenobia bacterium]|jgi:peptidoglycan/LPS O-acetylase OafA/YrhL